MCSVCSDIIDKDKLNYTVETLQQWRALAEREAHQALFGQEIDYGTEPTTLIALGFNIIAEAVWLGGSREKWRFRLKRYIEGDETVLRSFLDQPSIENDFDRFVAVETQGDGRLLTGSTEWERSTDQAAPGIIVTLPVQPRPKRTNPHDLGGDFALKDGDLDFTDGDIRIIQGIETAKQSIWRSLVVPYGSWEMHPEYGSQWLKLTQAHMNNIPLLERLFLLDLARMANIPMQIDEYRDTAAGFGRVEKIGPLLSYIEQVRSIEIINLDPIKEEVKVRIALRWAVTHEHWETELTIPIHQDAAQL
ncbi:hypothetical protein HRD49_14755 [Corallococcus exiguus]|uniref:hypothetical protein n=1 Tax=Corallococcus exiguus TaxID=83462 RepID=UPI00155FE983|nr:hypothetical protein [Corallococcus exiguus]NRD63007.1 hypothetical protein [Corallococcus exiguus]